MFGFPNFLLPGAGGNWQTIDTRWWSPNVTVNYAGNPAVERDVIENVASYGKQIGWLNEIVTALVKIEGESIGRESMTPIRDWTGDGGSELALGCTSAGEHSQSIDMRHH